MKYNYWSTEKAGKYHIRQLFILNQKSTATLSASSPIWTSMTEPIQDLKVKWSWYWMEGDKLKNLDRDIDLNGKMSSALYDELWFPVPPHYRIKNFITSAGVPSHPNFYECYDKIFDKDIITNPIRMLGYIGPIAAPNNFRRYMDRNPKVESLTEYVLDKFRERKNIIVYKENIRSLAYNYFSGNGRPESVDDTITLINNTIKWQKDLPRLLDEINVSYEMFSLDSGDYSKTFDLNKSLPIADHTKCDYDQNFEELTDQYMDLYH
mgnify:FL=1